MLLERQRQIIIDQEKNTHEQLVGSMKTELLLEVKDGVIQYQVLDILLANSAHVIHIGDEFVRAEIRHIIFL